MPKSLKYGCDSRLPQYSLHLRGTQEAEIGGAVRPDKEQFHQKALCLPPNQLCYISTTHIRSLDHREKGKADLATLFDLCAASTDYLAS